MKKIIFLTCLLVTFSTMRSMENEGTLEHQIRSAVLTGNIEKVQTLVSSNPTTIQIQSFELNTPLHFAALFGKILIAKLLLKYAPSIDAPNIHHRTPLHLALMRGDIEIAKILLLNGANTDIPDCEGKTPLHIAAEGCQSEIVQLLLNNPGIKVNCCDHKGNTPLHLAAFGLSFNKKRSFIHIVKLLLEHGGDANSKNNRQKKPLHLAAQNNSTEIAKLLLLHGAELAPRDNLQHTPCDIAEHYSHRQVKELLTDWPQYKRHNQKLITSFMLIQDSNESPIHNLTNNECENIVRFIRVIHSLDSIETIHKKAIKELVEQRQRNKLNHIAQLPENKGREHENKK